MESLLSMRKKIFLSETAKPFCRFVKNILSEKATEPKNFGATLYALGQHIYNTLMSLISACC